MAKKSKTITIIPLILLVILIIFANRSKQVSALQPLGDTVSATEFEPNKALKGKVYVDLHAITAVNFPRYKVVKQSVYMPDSVSLAADEETIAGGNYAATLLFDTIPPKELYARIDLAAQKDTFWKINGSVYRYTKIDKQGGTFKVTLIENERNVSVTHTIK